MVLQARRNNPFQYLKKNDGMKLQIEIVKREAADDDVTEYLYPPVRTVMCIGNDVLHHQLSFSQFLLQLSQLKVRCGGLGCVCVGWGGANA